MTWWGPGRLPRFLPGTAFLVGTVAVVASVAVSLGSGSRDDAGCGLQAVDAEILVRGGLELSCPPDGTAPRLAATEAEAILRGRWGEVEIRERALLLVRFGGPAPVALEWVFVIESPAIPPPLVPIMGTDRHGKTRHWLELVNAETGDLFGAGGKSPVPAN